MTKALIIYHQAKPGITEKPQMINIYSARQPHETVTISGNKADLEALKAAIEAELNKDNGCIDVFDSEGEAYTLQVFCVKDGAKIKSPYIWG